MKIKSKGEYSGIMCGECGKSVDAVIQIGEEPDFESRTAYVCLACLRKAMELLMEGEA